MSTTNTKPLLSDDQLYHAVEMDHLIPDGDFKKGLFHYPMMSQGQVREFYEADRAKHREVVQKLVDALRSTRLALVSEPDEDALDRVLKQGMAAYAAAKELGITPME